MAFFQFLEPFRLYLLIPGLVVIASSFILRWLVNRGVSNGLSLELVRKRWLGMIFFAVAFCLAIVAVSRPMFVSRDKTYNYMLLLDISLSMYCQDYQNGDKAMSRLDMAKANLIALMDELPAGSKMGLAVLAGYTLFVEPNFYGIDDVPSGGSFEGPVVREVNFSPVQPIQLEAPPTAMNATNTMLLTLVPPVDVRSSYVELRQMIESISPLWIWEGGSPIRSALAKLGFLMKHNPNSYGGRTVVLLITDGEEKEQFVVSEKVLTLSGEELGKNNLVVCFLGSEKPMPVPEYDVNSGEFKGYKREYGTGNPLLSRADKKFLKNIAELYGASYLEIKNVSDLKSLAHQDELKTVEEKTAKDMSWLAWLASMIFFVLSFVV